MPVSSARRWFDARKRARVTLQRERAVALSSRAPTAQRTLLQLRNPERSEGFVSCKQELCGGPRRDDQVHGAVQHVQETDQLAKTFARVGRIQQAVKLRHGGVQSASKLAAAES